MKCPLQLIPIIISYTRKHKFKENNEIIAGIPVNAEKYYLLTARNREGGVVFFVWFHYCDACKGLKTV